ncbi:hypothetical protein F5X96DRAFT_692449 [Biscogniauxia mediterranea]|nr:hypothetical protein F5X96DRAFT_692449 [Biscogniauxia mediterranea]
MRTSTFSRLTFAAISALLSIAYSSALPVQGREIIYCGGANDPTIATSGDPEEGPGIWVTNDDDDPNVQYFLYENSRDEHPWKYLTIPRGTRAFMQVCPTFQGRVVRGTAAVALVDGSSATTLRAPRTWVEFSLSGGGAVAWGDVSFLEGCDGGARLAATDGSGLARGCAAPGLLSGAPADALAPSAAGTHLVLAAVVDKPAGGGPPANRAARAWLNAQCDPDQVYIQDGNHAIISSADGRLDVVFMYGVA